LLHALELLLAVEENLVRERAAESAIVVGVSFNLFLFVVEKRSKLLDCRT